MTLWSASTVTRTQETHSKRALRLFLLAVLILILFNLALFARLFLSSKKANANAGKGHGQAAEPAKSRTGITNSKPGR